MELMIDSWNVLHQTGILPPESAGIGIRGLCTLIQRSRWGNETITLICDGTPSENTAVGPKIQTVFTGPNRTADDEIMDRVTNSSFSRSILVITSDREIIRSVKAGGAQHLSSSAFLQSLVDDCSSPKKKFVHRPSGLSRASAEEWRKEFGIDEQTIQDLHNTPMSNLRDEPASEPKEVEPPKEIKTRTIKPDAPILPDALLEEARRLITPRVINQEQTHPNTESHSD